MSFKIMVERKLKEPPSKEVIDIIHKIRIAAMKRKGYIGGETLVNYIDNDEVVIVAQWTTVESWNNWINSEERIGLERALSPYLAEPAKIRVFGLGFQL